MRQLTTAIIFVLLSASIQAAGDPYGRLFTTPDQRARLDGRFGGQGSSNDSAPDTVNNSQHQSERPLRLNGTLTSSVGKKEVWINGEGQLATGTARDRHVRLLNAGSVRVKPSSSGQEHDMKPGQLLDPSTGQVTEAYEQTTASYNTPQETDSGDSPDSFQ